MAESMSSIRTEKAITDALIRLVLQMPFEHITVQDILKEAPVSRYTFYAHFHDKYEVAEKLQQQQYDLFLSFLSQRTPGDSADRVNAALRSYTQSQRDAFTALRRIHTENVDFFGKIHNFFQREYRMRFEDHPHLELEATIYGSMMSGIQEYFMGQILAPDTDVAEALADAHIHIALNALGIHDPQDTANAKQYLLSLCHR